MVLEKKCIGCQRILELNCFAKDKTRKDGHQYYCRECEHKKSKKWRDKNRKALYQKNKEQYLKVAQAYRDKNREKVRGYWKKANAKRANDIRHRLSHRISSMVRKCIGRDKNNMIWESLVGYNIEQLKQRLECQFRDGMGWDNYGEWHIDHKKPVSLFKFKSYKDNCGKCEYVGVCGGCRARAYSMTGDYLAQEPFCSYVPRQIVVKDPEQ